VKRSEHYIRIAIRDPRLKAELMRMKIELGVRTNDQLLWILIKSFRTCVARAEQI